MRKIQVELCVPCESCHPFPKPQCEFMFYDPGTDSARCTLFHESIKRGEPDGNSKGNFLPCDTCKNSSLSEHSDWFNVDCPDCGNGFIYKKNTAPVICPNCPKCGKRMVVLVRKTMTSIL